jgi:hypothetical protein
MAITNQKKGSVLLIQGLDVSKPAEFVSDQACTQCSNVEVIEGLLSKRVGETLLGGIYSFGTLTLTANAGNTNTVVIGTKTYTFQTTLTNVDGNVLIGAAATDSLDNLIAAINLDDGAGTTYALATTACPSHGAAWAGAGDTMILRVVGSVATTETVTGAWGAGATAYPAGLEIMAGREFTREDVSYNIRIGLDKIEVWDNANVEWDDITGTDLTGANTDIVDTAVPLLTGKTILCITNGKDPIRKWTATGNTEVLGGTPPVAKFIQEYKTYLVVANVGGGTDVAERVQWSDTAKPETWDSGNAGAVDLVEDGGGITGLNLFGDYLCVHKDSSISLGYLVSSTAVIQFTRKSTGAGTCANNSIVNLPTGEQIFLAKDGLRLFNGNSAPLIDAPVNDEIRRTLNKESMRRSYGILVKDKDEVWIGIPIGDYEVGSTIYKFNYVTRVLYKDYRPNATFMWRGASTAGLAWDDISASWDSYDFRWDDTAFGTDAEQINIGYVNGTSTKININVNQDNLVNYNSFWDSKDFEHAQGTISRWKKIEFWAQGGSCDIDYSTDSGNTWYAMNGSPFTLTANMPSDSAPLIGYFDVVSSKIRFRFRNQNNEPFKLKQFIIEYTPREQR